MRVLGLLLLALLAPTAAACSLAGPVPGPGAFTLMPMDDGEQIVIAVEGRELGAGCELSNPHALDGTTFAWRETDWPRSGVRYEAHLLDLATGEKRTLRYGAGHTEGFALWDGRLLYVESAFQDGAPPTVRVKQLDLATGAEDVALALPGEHHVSVSARDGLVFAITRANGYEGPDAVHLFDLGSSRWILAGVPMRELTGEEIGWGRVLSAEWVELGAREGTRLYHVPTGAISEPRPPAAPTFGVAGTLVDGWMYGSLWDTEASKEVLTRFRFPDGPRERVETPPGRLVGIVPGFYVLGAYSAPELHPLGELQWVERPAVLVGGAALGLAGLVAVPTWRRMRARRR